MSNRKILFCGFGSLGVTCLDALISSKREVSLVLTHTELSGNGVDDYCKKNGIKFIYEDLRKTNTSLISQDTNLFEYLISVNYRYILPEFVLAKANTAINLHGSLLPKYRGRTPHVWAIIQGEKETGITAHLMVPEVDAGAIVHQERINIESRDTGADLIEKFKLLYPKVLLNALEKLENGFIPVEQNESEATYFGKRIPDMGYIDFRLNADQVINFVRAQAFPYPGAYCFDLVGRKYLVNKVKISSQDFANHPEVNNGGNIFKINEKFYLKCNDAFLEILEYTRI